MKEKDEENLNQKSKQPDKNSQSTAFDFEKNYFIPGISATIPKEKDQE